MRDFSCFGDAAVTLGAGGAAGCGSGGGGGAGAALDRSLQAATSSVYRVALSSRKELRIKVTWTRGLATAAGAGPTGIALDIDDDGSSSSPAPPPPPPVTLIGTPRRRTTAATAPAPAQHVLLLQKKRGTRSLVTDAGTAVSVYWDTAEAKYHPAGAAEPARDYHLAVVADGELALLLGGGGGGGGGDAARDVRRRFMPAPRRALLSRREQVRGPFSSSSTSPPPPVAAAPLAAAAAQQAQQQLVHTTRCRFRDGGAEHEVTVACRGEEWGGGGGSSSSRGGEVAVSVDGKKVVEARRVKWNFRGNRTAVLGDGAVVEVMWDVHDWWFAHGGGGGGGGAQFMVKARGAADGGGRVWMDEEMASKGHPPAGFFLHLQCYRQ